MLEPGRTCHLAAYIDGFLMYGYLENVSPELKPIEDTKVENIFYSSSVFRQLDMQPLVVQKMNIYSSPPADAKPRCWAKF